MPHRKVIGKFLPSQQVDLPSAFDRFLVKQTGYNERLNIIPSEIAPSRIKTIKRKAADGDLGELYELYHKMEISDSRYGGLISSLKSAISGMPIKVIAAEGATEGEQKIADDYAHLIEENLEELDLHNVVREFTDAYIKGAKVFELRYGIHEYPYNKKVAFVEEVRPISGAKLRMDLGRDSDTYGELMIRTQEENGGIPVSSFDNKKVIVVEDGNGNGYYDTLGAARKVLGWYITKVYAQLWWIEFVEIYGQPLRIGRYPDGAGKETRGLVEKFLKTLGKSAYGLFPQGMEVQLIEANKSGTVTTYQDIIKMANDEMTIALIGQVETIGDRSQGSHARAQVLSDIRFEIMQNVAKLVEKGFAKIARSVIEVNYGPDFERRLVPTVTPIIVNPQDSKTKVETFNAMSENGVPVPMDHYYEQTGVPTPKNGEMVLLNGMIGEYDIEQLRNGEIKNEQRSGDSESGNSAEKQRTESAE